VHTGGLGCSLTRVQCSGMGQVSVQLASSHRPWRCSQQLQLLCCEMLAAAAAAGGGVCIWRCPHAHRKGGTGGGTEARFGGWQQQQP
jgi:hypothetical protein